MGSRPHAILIYGFQLDTIGLCDDYEIGEIWKEKVATAAGHGKPAWYDLDYTAWSPEQKAEYRKIAENASIAVAAAPSPVRWGAMFDEPNYAFGFTLAETDWDDPCINPPTTPPPDAEAKIKEACAHFGIEMQPCALLLLAGYG